MLIQKRCPLKSMEKILFYHEVDEQKNLKVILKGSMTKEAALKRGTLKMSEMKH